MIIKGTYTQTVKITFKSKTAFECDTKEKYIFLKNIINAFMKSTEGNYDNIELISSTVKEKVDVNTDYYIEFDIWVPIIGEARRPDSNDGLWKLYDISDGVSNFNKDKFEYLDPNIEIIEYDLEKVNKNKIRWN